MFASQQCRECGADLPPSATAASCAGCLLRAGLAIIDNPPVEEGTDIGPILARRAEPLALQFHSFGDYELIEELARGGMGVVFKARQISLNRVVALKIIQTGRLSSAEAVRRFQLEAEAAARLDHPNIIPIHEVGEHDGHHYFTMKLVEGGSLATAAFHESVGGNRSPSSTRLRHTAETVAKVARAVHYAHQHGIIHRDLKPGNIFLDARGEPLVGDFGLAKLSEHDSGLTAMGDIMGTPSYMSPEQAEGKAKQLTTASDIWSLGAILYELLSGRPPFRGATAIETLREVSDRDPAPPRSFDKSVDADLETICLHCLEKDPARRYLSADALAEDLERWLRGEPITARPVRPFERAVKWARRQPMLAAAAAALVLVLALGIGGVFWQWRRAEINAAEQLKERHRTDAALARMQVLRSEDMLRRGDSAEALASLADVCRHDPSNHAAAERLLSALVQRTFLLPAAPPLRHDALISSAQLSTDDKRLLTASGFYARLWDMGNGALVHRLKHTNIVRVARFSADDQFLMTLCDDQAARVWDVGKGEIACPPLFHSDRLHFAAFSPDHRKAFIGSRNGTINVWDTRTGKLLYTLEANGGRMRTALFTPKGDALIGLCLDRTVRMWDTETGQPRWEPILHPDMVLYAHIGPGGLHFATACADGAARVWDLQTGRPVSGPMRHEAAVVGVRFSADGSRLATASSDRTARVWDALTGLPLTEPLRHGHNVDVVQFTPDGRRVLTASDDRTLRIWDAQTGDPVAEPLRHELVLRTPLAAKDGRRILTLAGDTIWTWDVQAGQVLAEPLWHDEAVLSLDFSLDGRRVVTGAGNVARVWDVESAQPLFEPLRHGGIVRSVHYSLNGRRILTAAEDGTARVWDATDGKPVAPPIQHGGAIVSAQFSPDGGRIATASTNGTVRLWDTQTGLAVGKPLEHHDPVWHVQFSRDGRRLVTTTDGRVARVWDAQTGELLTDPLEHGDAVMSADFNHDGSRIVTASDDRTARIWDAQTGRPWVDALQHGGKVRLAQFSADGRVLLTVAGDAARVWDAQTGQPVTEPIKHTAVVHYAQFSPDGRRVVTASEDRTARVWDARTGQPLTEPFPHVAGVTLARFSPDGGSFATASAGTVRVWRLPLTTEETPPWLAPLAEAIGGWRLNPGRVTEPIIDDVLTGLRAQIAALPASAPAAQWAQWILADRRTRAISPGSPITVPEYVRRRIAEDRVESLREAVSLAPDNALAFARLARLMATRSTPDGSTNFAEARWLIHRAVALAPNLEEVRRIQELIPASPPRHLR